MEEKRNPCLELVLDQEHQDSERIAREAVYRETSKQFPKKCTCCEKTYRTEEHFTRETKTCGAAMHHDEIGILSFMRNCECGSTLCLNLEHPQFDSWESYNLLDTMRVLGEECIKKIKPEMTSPDFYKTECGKCIAQYLNKYELGKVNTNSPDAKKASMHIGLNLFRERYNAWMARRATD